MSVLDRKLRRELWRSRGVLLAIVSIISVGVLSLVSMRALFHDLRGAQLDYYAQTRMADFWVDLKRAPVGELERIARLPGVSAVRTRLQWAATVDLAAAERPLNGLVLTLPDERSPVINDVVLRRGSYFSPTRENEVLLSDPFARAHGLGPGDTLHLLLAGRRQELHVVGTAISSEYIYMLGPGGLVPDPEHFGVFYVKRSFAEDVLDMEGAANSLVGLLSPERRRHPEPLLDRIELRLADYGVLAATPRKDQTSHVFVDSEIEGLGVFATILPAIFLAVAALLLNVLLTRLAEQQRTVIGTLKAIGYGNRQIFAHFIQYGLLVGLVGGVLGNVAGYLLANGMTGLYQKYFEFPRLETQLYPGVYLAGMGVSVICAMLGAVRGASLATRLRPAEAMRPKPPRRGRRVWIERVGWLWGRLSSGWRMALRNVFRQRMRTGVGLFAAAMGTARLVVTFMAWDAMYYLIDFQFEKIQLADIDLTFDAERGRDALDEARRLPGVDRAEPLLAVACTFTNGPRRRKGAILGLAAGARLTQPRDTEGRPLRIPPVGLLLTPRMAQILDVAEGDLVRVRPSRGLQRPIWVPVARVTESYLGTGVYADLEYLCGLVDEEFALSGVQLAVDPDPTVRRALYAHLKQLPAVEGVGVKADMVANIRETLVESQTTSLAVLLAFAGVIFFGSVLNASLVSLAERRREVATLRTLGYGSWQIGGLLLRESLLVNVAGTLVGMPIGWLLYFGVTKFHDLDFFRLPLVASPWVWVATALMSLTFALAAHLVVQWRIGRLDWLDALNVLE